MSAEECLRAEELARTLARRDAELAGVVEALKQAMALLFRIDNAWADADAFLPGIRPRDISDLIPRLHAALAPVQSRAEAPWWTAQVDSYDKDWHPLWKLTRDDGRRMDVETMTRLLAVARLTAREGT